MGQLGHPYASQVKASVKRRLRALGATGGKSWGRSSMDVASNKYPQTHAGTERPMTIAGKNASKRPDRYARGGKVKGGKHVTNVVIAQHPPAAPQDRPLPVPVPVGGGPAPMPMRGAAPPPAGAPPALGPGLAGQPPMRPPGMKSGGAVLSPHEEYHNWGKGYARGGHVKKAGGGMIAQAEKDMGGASKHAYPGYPHSPTKEGINAVSPTKRGGAVKKRAKGGAVHSDEAADRKLFGKMMATHEKKEMEVEGKLKHKARGGHVESEAHEKKERKLLGEMVKLEKAEHKAHGGVVKKASGGLVHAGSGSGEGRLEKSRMARKIPAHTEL
jgi:hypothetical protein